MTEGWVALHRMLVKKAIWKCSSPEHKVILITLLLLANHEENEWEWGGRKFKAMPGQFVTSLESIKRAAGRGISTQNIRGALKKFKKYGFLTEETTKTGRLITIVNWGEYQDKSKKPTKQVTPCQQRGNKQVTTNNNDNNDNNIVHEHFFEKLWGLYPRKRGKGQVTDAQKKRLSKIGWERMERCISKYKAEMQKEGRPPDKYQYGSTFFNSGYLDYLEEEREPAKHQRPKLVIVGTLDEM